MSLFGGLWNNQSLNLCVSASSTADETGTFESGSNVWQYYKFTTPGNHTLTIHSGSADNARVLVVAGGGAGGHTINTTQPSGIQADNQAGGGGAGGVVYTQTKLQSRTYNIKVGNGGTYPQKQINSGEGEDSFIYPLYAQSDNSGSGQYFPTASQLTALGGGAGAYSTFQIESNPYWPGGSNGTSGGSGGGGIFNTLVRNVNSVTSRTDFGEGLAEVANQGHDGGTYDNQGTILEATSGAGGSKFPGQDATIDNIGTRLGQAGEGQFFTMDGTGSVYATGGPGMLLNQYDGNPYTSSYGGGGSGSSDEGSNPGSTIGPQVSNGQNGVVIIAIPLCTSQVTNCTQYTFESGPSGGNISFIPCGTTSSIVDAIEPYHTGSFCTFVIDTLPSASGDVLLTATGSCYTYIPIEPQPSCDTGSGEFPDNMYLWEYERDSQCYPTPASCQRIFYLRTTIVYVDGNGTVQQLVLPEGFAGPKFGEICARTTPTPQITGGTILKSNIICDYYCSSSADDSSNLIASGGQEIGQYVDIDGNESSSLYRWHEFTNLGYQELTLLGGSTTDFNALAVAGGGSGQNGGGGAGGFLTASNQAVTSNVGTIQCTVGDGGASGSNGNNTWVFGSGISITSDGGGYGGVNATYGQAGNGGGSGGGGGASTLNGVDGAAGGQGIVGEGNDGAAGEQAPNSQWAGGGGGAGTAGNNFNGGDGKTNNFKGYDELYSRGGQGNNNVTPTPDEYGNGGNFNQKGKQGVVVMSYKYDSNIDNRYVDSPTQLPVSRSLSTYIDVAYTESYAGSGSILYDIGKYSFGSASLSAIEGYQYNTAVLDSGSLIEYTSSLATVDNRVTFDSNEFTTKKNFTMCISWFGNFMDFNTTTNLMPLWIDSGSNWGINGGDASYDHGIVFNAGGQLVEVGNDTARESGGGFGWHISQIAYDSTTDTLSYFCDGDTSGSVIVSGSSLPSDWNPVYNQKIPSGQGGGGLGDNSAFQIFALYDEPLTEAEMRTNWLGIYQRY